MRTGDSSLLLMGWRSGEFEDCWHERASKCNFIHSEGVWGCGIAEMELLSSDKGNGGGWSELKVSIMSLVSQEG